MLFQSTLSVRRATSPSYSCAVNCMISIHALRKESDQPALITRLRYKISIHALRKESDVTPTPASCCMAVISIHALRKESDGDMPMPVYAFLENFNPRSP